MKKIILILILLATPCFGADITVIGSGSTELLYETELDTLTELQTQIGSTDLATQSELDALLTDEASLYSELSGVTDFVQPGDAIPANDLTDVTGALDIDLGTYTHQLPIGTAGELRIGLDNGGTVDTNYFSFINESGTPKLKMVGNAVIESGAMTSTDIGLHITPTGEVAEESIIPAIMHKTWSFDPDAVCDGDVDRLFLMTVGDEAPNGIVIDEWSVSFEADPTTEADLDLKYADAFIGVANAAVIDILDTTTGTASEDTDANINAGVAVANTKVIYLEFGTAYTETGHQIIFEVWYHAPN